MKILILLAFIFSPIVVGLVGLHILKNGFTFHAHEWEYNDKIGATVKCKRCGKVDWTFVP